MSTFHRPRERLVERRDSAFRNARPHAPPPDRARRHRPIPPACGAAEHGAWNRPSLPAAAPARCSRACRRSRWRWPSASRPGGRCSRRNARASTPSSAIHRRHDPGARRHHRVLPRFLAAGQRDDRLPAWVIAGTSYADAFWRSSPTASAAASSDHRRIERTLRSNKGGAAFRLRAGPRRRGAGDQHGELGTGTRGFFDARHAWRSRRSYCTRARRRARREPVSSCNAGRSRAGFRVPGPGTTEERLVAGLGPGRRRAALIVKG